MSLFLRRSLLVARSPSGVRLIRSGCNDGVAVISSASKTTNVRIFFKKSEDKAKT